MSRPPYLPMPDRVEAGFQLLRSHRAIEHALLPAGVTPVDVLDLDVFDVADPSTCLIGQSFLTFEAGLDALGLTANDDLADYGFDVTWVECDTAGYDRLNTLWCERIEAHRTASGRGVA